MVLNRSSITAQMERKDQQQYKLSQYPGKCSRWSSKRNFPRVLPERFLNVLPSNEIPIDTRRKSFEGNVCSARKMHLISAAFLELFSERLQKECLALHSEREQIHSTAVMQFRRIMKLLLQYCTCIWILKNVDFEKWGRRRRRRRKRHAEWNTFREVLTFFHTQRWTNDDGYSCANSKQNEEIYQVSRVTCNMV